MKRAIFVVLALLASVETCNAHAWSYIVIDGGGQDKFFEKAPRDLTYPPGNIPVSVRRAPSDAPQPGIPLSPQQERDRLDADMLIIVDIPGLQYERDALP